MADIEQDAAEALQARANESVSIGYASVDFNIVQEGPAATQQQEGAEETAFKFDEFRKALDKGDEVALYHALVSSNLQTNQALKVPMELLYIDWQIPKSFTYWSIH